MIHSLKWIIESDRINMQLHSGATTEAQKSSSRKRFSNEQTVLLRWVRTSGRFLLIFNGFAYLKHLIIVIFKLHPIETFDFTWELTKLIRVLPKNIQLSEGNCSAFFSFNYKKIWLIWPAFDTLFNLRPHEIESINFKKNYHNWRFQTSDDASTDTFTLNIWNQDFDCRLKLFCERYFPQHSSFAVQIKCSLSH